MPHLRKTFGKVTGVASAEVLVRPQLRRTSGKVAGMASVEVLVNLFLPSSFFFLERAAVLQARLLLSRLLQIPFGFFLTVCSSANTCL